MSQQIKHVDWYADSWVNHWHRDTFGEKAFAYDVDLMGVCARCLEPLYLIEATRSSEKSTTFLKKLARRANVPAILVQHSNYAITRCSFVSLKGDTLIGGEEELKDTLTQLRFSHDCDRPDWIRDEH